MRKFVALTGNSHKLLEFMGIFQALSPRFKIVQRVPKSEEAHYSSFEKTAEAKLLSAVSRAKYSGSSVWFAEDSGLEIECLKGFPGVFSAGVLSQIGLNGILKLLEGKKNRRARFVCAVAFIHKGAIRTVRGECKGSLATKPRGKGGFGYDPLFIPSGHSTTFAEAPKLKLLLSHRRKALASMLHAIKDIVNKKKT